MLEQHTNDVVLTPEQRRQLGHVYRLILSWRREHRNKLEKTAQAELTSGENQSPQVNPKTAGTNESES